jgi:hypothetical protein
MAYQIHWNDMALLKRKYTKLELEAMDTLSRKPGEFGADQMMMRVSLLDLKQSIDELVEKTQTKPKES